MLLSRFQQVGDGWGPLPMPTGWPHTQYPQVQLPPTHPHPPPPPKKKDYGLGVQLPLKWVVLGGLAGRIGGPTPPEEDPQLKTVLFFFDFSRSLLFLILPSLPLTILFALGRASWEKGLILTRWFLSARVARPRLSRIFVSVPFRPILQSYATCFQQSLYPPQNTGLSSN